MGRFDIATGSRKTEVIPDSGKTAVERGMEMMNTPRNKLPKLALEYELYLSREYGGCGEVSLTAFAHYAQAIEGLKTLPGDKLYKIDDEGKKFFM